MTRLLAMTACAVMIFGITDARASGINDGTGLRVDAADLRGHRAVPQVWIARDRLTRTERLVQKLERRADRTDRQRVLRGGRLISN